MGRKFTFKPYKLKYPRRHLPVSRSVLRTATNPQETDLLTATHQPQPATISQQPIAIATAEQPTAEQPILPAANLPDISCNNSVISSAGDFPSHSDNSQSAVSIPAFSVPVSPSTATKNLTSQQHVIQKAAITSGNLASHSYSLCQSKLHTEDNSFGNPLEFSQRSPTSPFIQQPKSQPSTSSQSQTSTFSGESVLTSDPLLYHRSNFTPSSLQNVCLEHIKDLLPPEWNAHMEAGELVLFNIRILRGTPQIYFSLQIAADSSWVAKLCEKKIEQSQLLQDMPVQISVSTAILDVVHKLDAANICTGNEDDRFLDLAETKKGRFFNRDHTEIVAFLDEKILPHDTVRHSNCELLVSGSQRCSACSKHRKSMRAILSRKKTSKNTSTEPSSHVNYRFLSDHEKMERLKSLHREGKTLKQRVKRITKRLEEILETHGSTLDEELHSDMKSIMAANAQSIADKHPPDTFARVFWEQQMKASSQCDARQMRWHPAMIKWCIYLRHRSSGAYEMLRKNGCLHLPSQRTLRDYTHVTSSRIGFSNEVDEMLMKTARIHECLEHEKFVAVIFDEMHIRSDLVYDKNTGELVGFCDVGDINNYLLEVERSIEEDHQPVLAKTMLVFMVRSLFGPLKFPYAQFSTKDISGDILFWPFWDVVFNLEKCGFKVIAATADGASPNRAFLRIHFPTTNNFEYRTKNPFSTEERFIYFFSDPPHLLKTIRNCLANSKRNLWCKGEEISWRHIISLYYRDNGSAPLSLAPKLKYEHVYLTSFSKMRVDLAAQVLSGTVAAAIRMTGNRAAQRTAEFIELVNHFFDCLNVTNFDEGKHTRNCFKDPIRREDFRLKWLEQQFLHYLEEWEDSVRKREGDFSVAERNKMLLSVETLLGIRFTVRSFIDMVTYLFKQPNIKSFLSEKISQDPLEKFFGIQRQRGRVNENPSVREFCQNTQALRVIDSVCADVSKGNTRGNRSCDLPSDQPLAKRRCQKRHYIYSD